MKFLCCLVVIAVSATFANGTKCEVPCTREFHPVCGSNGEHFKIFNNPCLMRNEHCKDGRNWAQTRMDACNSESNFEEDQNCEVPCTREFRPVCGSDGEHFKIFSNPCLMRNEHCKDGRNWAQTRMDACNSESNSDEDQNCEVPCTREFRPVCGSDGEHFKIFNNPCLMRNEHCKDGRNWAQTRMDACNSESNFEEDQNCEVPCTREFRPVCGSDGEHFKIFNNPCLMRNEHCKDGHNWAQTRMDACNSESNVEEDLNCEVPCTRELRPVCGSDGEHFKIFPNPCVLRNQHCKDGLSWIQTRMAKCTTDIKYTKNDEDNCIKFCPALFAPVCGFDGKVYKIFPNKCMMETTNCREHKNFQKSSFEKCSTM